MTRCTWISFTRKARRARGKETTRARCSPKAKAKEKANTMMRQAINQYLKARKGFKLKEREDDPMYVDFVHKESAKGKGKGNDKGKVQSKGKSEGKGKHNEKGKSSGKGKSSQETFRGTCRHCGKTGLTWSECWARGGGAAKQANSVGETEKTGDWNWIMMIQQFNDGQAITRGHETWRCSGTSVSCHNAHASQVVSHAESDHVIPNSSVAASRPTQQSTIDLAHQLDIRPESVNQVILKPAKRVVDSACFDHCRPLGFATLFEVKRGTIPQRVSCEHNQAQAPRRQCCRGLDERRERCKDSAQDQSQRI